MRSHQEQIQALNTEIVIVTFGPEHLARLWLQETQAPFLVLLDEERLAYRAYGLGRSLLHSWGPKIGRRYAQLLLAGRKWRGIQGDSGQLGGDFIIDINGVLRFVHPSRDPTDRPTVTKLLEVLTELNTS